eukprot:gene13262-17768_t
MDTEPIYTDTFESESLDVCSRDQDNMPQPSTDKDDEMIVEEQSSDYVQLSNDNNSGSLNENKEDVPPQTTFFIPIPSLRGTMALQSGSVVCKGVWAMSDAAHEQPDQTSDFEFRLVKAAPDSTSFPFNGKYQGWFHLKQLKQSLKIDDKDMELVFIPDENGHSISGKGINYFGKFTLRGTLSSVGQIQLYREYDLKAVAPIGRKKSIGTPVAVPKSSENKKKSIQPPKNLAIKPVPSSDLIPVPLESNGGRESGRVRKTSSFMQDFEETPLRKIVTPKPFSSSKQGSVSFPQSQQVLQRTESVDASGRGYRVPKDLQKCGDLLKELSKYPQAAWFLEPVDYVRLNIPEYPSIITHPMDFGTIRLYIETKKDYTPDHFAEHMRLVFKNAMTFNQLRDNPVHIAARELSNRFEDKFRVYSSQFSTSSQMFVEPPARIERTTSRSSIGGNKEPGGKKGAPKNRLSSAPIKYNKSGNVAGPRSAAPPVVYMAPAMDGSSQQLLEMARRMEEMQSELQSLRTVVQQKDIINRVKEKKEAAHNPLTFEEKKTLIDQIHILPPDAMENIISIIQAALPNSGTNDEFEVPLDALDTYTLRKLQKFIEEYNDKKKRHVIERTVSYSAVEHSNSNKRQRKNPPKDRNSLQSIPPSQPVRSLTTGAIHEDMLDDEHFLFSSDELTASFHKDDEEDNNHENNNDNSNNQLYSMSQDGEVEDFDAMLNVNSKSAKQVVEEVNNSNNTNMNTDAWTKRTTSAAYSQKEFNSNLNDDNSNNKNTNTYNNNNDSSQNSLWSSAADEMMKKTQFREITNN